MRNVSRQYMQTAENRRDFYAKAEITFANGIKKPLEKEDFTLSGNNYTESGETSSFPLGLLVAKRVKFALMNDDDRWSDFDFYGAKIFLQTGFDLDDGTTEFLNIGTFTVITPETYGVTVTITAMDDSYKTDIDYSTELTFPVSAGVALQDSCKTCGITLLTENFANADYVIPQRPEELTHRQFIGMVAMIAGGNAVMDEYNRLKIISYDFTPFERFQGFDGGRFDYNDLTKYTTGDTLDGGSFVPWSTGDTADGGQFGDRDNVHILYRFKNSPTIDVDDVVITGIQLESTDADNNTVAHLFGSVGYVLKLDNQLAAGKEDEALALIGAKIVGLRFRPFSGDHIALPTAEFMDLAFVADWKSNFYQTVITDVSFTYFGCTSLKCTADSPVRNSSKYYGNMTKAIVQARQMVRKEKTEREKALEVLSEELARSSGLYMTEEQQEDKSIIYYMHDKPTLEESRIVWKLTAEAFGISTDGGKTYPYGLDATGLAILDRIYAIGINCSYFNTGVFKIEKDGKVMVLMDMDTGQVILRPDTFELSSGATIYSIAEDEAKSALSSAKAYADSAASSAVGDFVTSTYDPKIAELQRQLDGQIESFYYEYAPTLDNAPASGWLTEADRQKHEGDLFYDKSNGYAYRFFKDGSVWKWQLIQDTDITKALAQAAAAQDTADKKRRVFVAQPEPPYDVGDMWVQGDHGDIMRCQTAKPLGAGYASGDWVRASKYTDDTELKNFLTTYEQDIDVLRQQADKKAETWYQTDDPSVAWNTQILMSEHVGDIWYDTGNQETKRWNGSAWVDMKTTPPDAVFNQIDGKAQIFIEQPEPPYRKGDLWFDSASSDIMTCIKDRLTGMYTKDDWEKRNKYIDQSAANTAASNAVNNLSQADVLNKLTNSGIDKGIYLKDGKLYISFNAARGGDLILGGKGDGNGRLSIHDENDSEIGYIDNTGVHFNKGSISGTSLSISGNCHIEVLDKNGSRLMYVSPDSSSFKQLSCENMYVDDLRVRKTGGNSKVRITPEYIYVSNQTDGGTAGYITSYVPSSAGIGSSGLKINGTAGLSVGILGLEALTIDGNFQTTFLHGLKINGTLTISGSKSRVVSTRDYRDRLLYCYEMPSPMFGDIGEAVTDEDGECYIYLDDVFGETVSAQIEYQVFLQKEGEGDVWISEKTPQYFVVKGTENLKFAWEVKAKQRDYEYERLEDADDQEQAGINYEQQYLDEIEGLIKEKEAVLI